MSRGKNGAGFRRGRENRTLGWYIGVESNQDRENVFSATSKRQNSFDSESSNGRQTGNEKEERKRRANKNRNRSQNSQNGNEQVVQNDAPRSNPIPIGVSAKNDSLVGSDQQVSSLQQQLLAQVAVQKENYWYYDSNTDGYFYEFCGSRGWRKRNPKIHGNPLPNTAKKVAEGSPQTIEKKVYVPVPIPIFTNSKFFPQVGTSPNIKYFDSKGCCYETPHAEVWKKRSSTNPNIHAMEQTANQRDKFEPSSLTSFPPLNRDLTSQELEELILAKVKTGASNPQVSPYPAIISKNLRNVWPPQRQPEADYPSSSSTVSTVSDDVTPPPAIGKENQLFAQTKETSQVGSFDEPYEFYWSDNEKADNAQQASSVSSMDDYNPLSAYFNEMSVNMPTTNRQSIRVQRPSSLKIANPVNDKRLPRFNVDKFIEDLPGSDNFMNGMYASFGTDSPRTPFNNANNQYLFNKESPMFTPLMPKERPFRHFMPAEEIIKEKASADNIERGLRDIEKIWQSS